MGGLSLRRSGALWAGGEAISCSWLMSGASRLSLSLSRSVDRLAAAMARGLWGGKEERGGEGAEGAERGERRERDSVGSEKRFEISRIGPKILREREKF